MSSLSEYTVLGGQQKALEWMFLVSCDFAPQLLDPNSNSFHNLHTVGCIDVSHIFVVKLRVKLCPMLVHLMATPSMDTQRQLVTLEKIPHLEKTLSYCVTLSAVGSICTQS